MYANKHIVQFCMQYKGQAYMYEPFLHIWEIKDWIYHTKSETYSRLSRP